MKKFIRKNNGDKVRAWELGKGSAKELELLENEVIIKLSDEEYEIFSQDTRNGVGERAAVGDFLFIDEEGYPYSIARAEFDEDYDHISGDCYEKLPKNLLAWEAIDEITPEMNFLIRNEGLTIRYWSPEEFFLVWCPLKGYWTEPISSVLVFEDVVYDDDGAVREIGNFRFIKKEKFDQTYHYC